ncbi:prolipoprotein diacylglyceryl transferase [Hutsoniella sourekii]|uniref:prolipoprotein diacylglyceryl transferase n=1 Tax=Hutsoniella sourekii TaxID=87650 RepID=UPI00048422FC|nr:prolipoprotein diacylglyceryl transferase [Hutsoniella sourekii]
MTLAWIDPVAFELFGVGIRWYAIIIALGAAIGYFMFLQEGRRLQLDEDTLFDLFFWSVIIGLVGARLYYVIFSFKDYIDRPWDILNIRQGGMAIYGGVLAGIATIYYQARKRGLSFITLLDIAAPATMMAQAIGRWGNFVNQEAHGGPVSRAFLESLYLPSWMIQQLYIDQTYVHPTFLYESVWCILGVLVMIYLRNQPKLLRQGGLVACYCIWYGLGRFWIEALRTDSLYLGGLRVSQALSLILIIMGLYLLYYQRKNGVPFYSDRRKVS